MFNRVCLDYYNAVDLSQHENYFESRVCTDYDVIDVENHQANCIEITV